MHHQIHSLELGDMGNLIHIIEDKKTAKAMVVDPAWGADAIFKFIKDKGLELVGVLMTHSHGDHINALADILEVHPLPVYISRQEYEFYGREIPGVKFVADNDIIELGRNKIRALFTPGHTPGGCCYLIYKQLICGDTLFVYGCGICCLPGGNPGLMFDTLTRLKSELEPDVVIYPAHTYSVTNTSHWHEQLKANPFLLIDNRDDFVKFRMQIHDKVRQYPMAPIEKSQLRKWLEL